MSGSSNQWVQGVSTITAGRSRSWQPPPLPCRPPALCRSFVSFSEILMRKSVAGFQAVSIDENAAYRWSTLCFFGGMVVVAILDRVRIACCYILAAAAGRQRDQPCCPAAAADPAARRRLSVIPLPAASFPGVQIVHMLAHLGAKHSQRKAAARGRNPASTSTANLLSHEDQRNARRAVAATAAAPTTVPAVPSMPKLRHASEAGPAAAGAGQDVENIGSAASTPRAAGDAGAPAPSEAGGSEACDGGPSGRSSVSTHLNELSAPATLLTEPCDAMTSAVVAASCPDTVVGGDAADKPGGGGEVSAPGSRGFGRMGSGKETHARWDRGQAAPFMRPCHRSCPCFHRRRCLFLP